MSYSGSPSEKPVAAGDLDRSHIGQTVSFEPNDFTVVFGTLSGVARTDAMVYLSLQGVGGGTHLKDEYDLPVGHNVYVQMDPLSSAEQNPLGGGTGHQGEVRRDQEESPGSGTETRFRVTWIQPARNPAVPGTAGFLCLSLRPGRRP